MKKLPFIFLFLFKLLISSAQTVASCHKEGGAFISEVGNISHADFIELTVYGSTSNPTAPVNMENWILDDNNFTLGQTGSHTGHIRLHGDCFKAVMPGTVILIYTNLVQQQLITDLDAPSGYNMRLSQTCLIRIKDCPSKDYPNDYSSCLNNYNGNDGAINLKHYIPLRNEGDVIQLMNAEGELQHAIYWIEDYAQKDNPRAVNVINKLQNGSANKLSIKFISDRDWFNPANYIADNDFSTLGTANNTAHKSLIDKCKDGTFASLVNTSANVSIIQQPTSKNNDGIVEINITGGSPPFSVTFSNDKFFRIEYYEQKGTYQFKNLPGGDYNVYVGDQEDCGIITEVALTKALAVCANNNGCQTIGVPHTQYCRYEWIAHPDINDVTKNMVNVCPKQTTTYQLKVINNDGNIEIKSFTVEIKAAEMSQTITLYCDKEKEISVKGDNPIWDTGETTNTIKIDKVGTYGVEVTDDSGCRVKGNVEVLSMNSTNIKRFFRSLGFYETKGVVRDFPPARPAKDNSAVNDQQKDRSLVCNVKNFSDKTSVYLDGEEVKLRQEFVDLCENGNTNAEQFYISENEHFCSNFDAMEKQYLSSTKVYWAHKFLGDENVLFAGKNFGDLLNSNVSISVDKNSKVHSFYAFTDRGEYLGEYSCFRYNIPSGIYFFDHQKFYKFGGMRFDNDKKEYYSFNKAFSSFEILFPFSKISDVVEFYIDQNVSNTMRDKFMSGNKLGREIGGICFENSNLIDLDQCFACIAQSNSTTFPKAEGSSISNYTKTSEPFIAWWHTHPANEPSGAQPSGRLNSPFLQCAICECDMGGLGSDLGKFLNKISYNNQTWLFYKLKGGIAFIYSQHGITIFRSKGYTIFETNSPVLGSEPINGKYYENIDEKQSICTLRTDGGNFPKGQHYAVIPYSLNSIKMVLLKQ